MHGHLNVKLEKFSFCLDGEAQIKCDQKIKQGAIATKDRDAHRGLGARESMG